MDAPVCEEDRVVYLLASLPDSYNMIVTALETQSESVPKWSLVTERLLHQEAKMKEKDAQDGKALSASSQQKQRKPKSTFKCHFCRKMGHFKRECRKLLASQSQGRQSANPTESEQTGNHILVLTTHALSATDKGTWIVDSGATTHMCNDSSLFRNMKKLEPPLQVTLGDGHSLEGTAEGTVVIETLLPDGGTTICRLENTMYVPGLSYSRLSVSKASSDGNTTSFDKARCEITNDQKNVIAFATRAGNLYHLEYCRKSQSANVADKTREIVA